MNKSYLFTIFLLSLLLISSEATGCYYKYCKGKRKFDRKSCSCKCPNTCPDNQKQDYFKCTCSCKASCPDNQTQQDDCSCVCKDQCPANKTQQDDCSCVCTDSCSAPKTVQDPDTCECSCPSVTCDPNFAQNPDDCQCECAISQADCGDNELFNPQLCACIPQVIDECPAGKVEKCECICDPAVVCGANEKKNPTTCECECQLTQADCGNNATLNPQLCTCIPNIVDCPDGKVLVDGVCVCKKKKCIYSRVQDPETCKCGRCKAQTCPSGMKWSYYYCKCIKNSHGG